MSAEWIKTAKVGDKVCLREELREKRARELSSYPVLGVVYTIREIVEFEAIEGIGLRLEEVVNPPTFPWLGKKVEPAFNYERFRPVQPRQTDISIFHEILRKAGQPAKEVA